MNRTRCPDISLVYLDQFDPEHARVSGIESCIADQVRGGDAARMGLVGVSSSATLGDWRMVEFEGRQVPFLPVARPSKGRLPDSLKLASGILRYRAQLPRATYQVHRVELGWLIGRVLRKPMVQFTT